MTTMLWLRAARSAISSSFRQTAARSRLPSSTAPAFARTLNTSLQTPLYRSFCAEPGFPDRDDVTSRVLEVVRKFEKVQPEKVTDSSHFGNDLGLDSLDTVELVMAFEDEFGIEIADADAEKILTCTDAVDYLSNNIHVK